MNHTITVTPTLECLAVELCDFTAEIMVNWIPDSGDGWNAELSSVKQVSGPFIEPAKLFDWADVWVRVNQDTIALEIADAGGF